MVGGAYSSWGNHTTKLLLSALESSKNVSAGADKTHMCAFTEATKKKPCFKKASQVSLIQSTHCVVCKVEFSMLTYSPNSDKGKVRERKGIELFLLAKFQTKLLLQQWLKIELRH